MPKEIKTKTTFKDIKILDKTASGTAHVHNAFVKSKDTAVGTQQTSHDNAEIYASDKLEGGAKSVAQSVTNRFRNPKQKITENVNKAKEHFRNARQQLPKARKDAAEQAKRTAETAKSNADKLGKTADNAKKTAQDARKAVTDAKRTYQQTKRAGRQTLRTAKQTVKTGQQTEKTIKTTAKAAKTTGKGTIKIAKKTVKTAEKSAKVAVKTAQRTAKAAAHTAKATARTAKMAAQTARAAAKAAVAATKAAVKVTVALVKATIAAIKGLIAIIAAGGWVAVLIIVIICLIGLLVGSIFGIFFSGEDSGTGRSMPAVVQELQTEFYNKIEDIKNSNAHDVLDVDAMSINWPEVLAIYAVRVNTDPENPAEVATLDDDKVNRLREALNDAVTLSHSTKTETQERTVTTTDEDGNKTETTESVTITILTITVSHKSADDMAAQYGFNQEQKDQMHELLSPEYADLWAALLGEYSAGNGEIGIPDASRTPKDIFVWPIGEGFPITSNFGYRKDPFTGETRFHGGTDVGAPEGTPLLAAADGTVTVANGADTWAGGYGYYVKIQHTGGYETLYAHCSRIAVVNGQAVQKGQVIAYVGTTGNSTGNHLHFEIRKDGTRTNPLHYFE